MERILITGSNGLLGQKLTTLLRDKKEVTLLATSRGPERMAHEGAYRYLDLDLTDKAAVHTAVLDFKPTAIINTAALTLVDLCETEKEACQAINVDAVATLLSASEAVGAHLVHVSTDFVFDGTSGPYREEDEVNPLSEYARSKHEAEQLLIRSDYKHWAIARTIILYGVGENMSRSNVVVWAREILKAGGEMNIVDDQFRSPTLAEDLADGCWAIAQRKAKGIYHLSGPEVMSIHEMVIRIAKYYDFDASNVNAVQTDALSRPAARPPYTGFHIDKARRDLDYAPRSIEEGLAVMDEQSPL